MMSNESNNRDENINKETEPSFHALMYAWSLRTSVIALEMVVPVLLGVGLDRLLGTVALFAILGVIAGMALGFWQLLAIAKKAL